MRMQIVPSRRPRPRLTGPGPARMDRTTEGASAPLDAERLAAWLSRCGLAAEAVERCPHPGCEACESPAESPGERPAAA